MPGRRVRRPRLSATRPGLRYLGIFTLIGLYVGVIPVAIGLLWFPMVARQQLSSA